LEEAPFLRPSGHIHHRWLAKADFESWLASLSQLDYGTRFAANANRQQTGNKDSKPDYPHDLPFLTDGMIIRFNDGGLTFASSVEPGSRIWPTNVRSNHLQLRPFVAGSSWKRHVPASDRTLEPGAADSAKLHNTNK
jgi:hypothetical protein